MKRTCGVIGVILGAGLLGVVLLGLVIQLVPYGKNHTNPPVLQEPNWDAPETRALAQRACFDCHSNETVWPWYSSVAPISWLVWKDVAEGREHLNLSEWGVPGARTEQGEEPGELSEEVGETISEGEMPPASYILLHPSASLTSSEKAQLIEGLNQSLR